MPHFLSSYYLNVILILMNLILFLVIITLALLFHERPSEQGYYKNAIQTTQQQQQYNIQKNKQIQYITPKS